MCGLFVFFFTGCLGFASGAVPAASAGKETLLDAVWRRGVVIRAPSFDIEEIRLPPAGSRERAYWQSSGKTRERFSVSDAAADNTSRLSPNLGEIRFVLHDFEGRRQTQVTVWLFSNHGTTEHRPAFMEFDAGDGLSVTTWDFELGFGDESPCRPDRKKTAVWIVRHRSAITDAAFLAVVSDFFWHNQQLDAPPGSYNRVIELNLRILELEPHVASVYGTTAWLMWSKWVTWKQNPLDMPDGKTKLNEALKLLERGARQNPDSPQYFFEAGTVLLPLMRHHRPDLTPLVHKYLRRAAELARTGKTAVRVWRTYAGVLYLDGNPAEARRWYEKVLTLAPGDPVARRRLAAIEESRRNGTGADSARRSEHALPERGEQRP